MARKHGVSARRAFCVAAAEEAVALGLVKDALLSASVSKAFVPSTGGDTPRCTARQRALAAGMRTMLACGVEKAARGITSLQEVLRVIPHGPND